MNRNNSNLLKYNIPRKITRAKTIGFTYQLFDTNICLIIDKYNLTSQVDVEKTDGYINSDSLTLPWIFIRVRS